MKKVMIIAYQFPPEGGPAVQRVLKFVKYLPKYCYLPFVLTAKYPFKTFDATLLEDIPSDIKVFRTKDWGTNIPFEIKKLFKKIFIPDKHALWKYTSIKMGIEIVKKEKIDLIFSTSPPHSVHLVAKKIAELSHIPWIADFRDEWTTNSLFHKMKNHDIHHKLENSVLERCNYITTIIKKAKTNFMKKCEESKIHVIKNGFDPDDFANLKFIKNKAEKLVITYCGRLNRLHSPKLFFQALSNMKVKKKINSQNLIVNIVGNIENQKWLRNFPNLKDLVKFYSYQPHDKCIEMMANSSVLLLLATEMNITEMLPAKMFEYFYLKKPIFAILSFRGELSSTLKEYGNSYIGYESGPDSIETSFNKLLSDWKNKSLEKSISDDFLSQFNREMQTQKLVDLFNQTV